MFSIMNTIHGFATAALLCALASAVPSHAAALSTKQAMALCKMKYGMGVTSATIKKNGHIVCQEGPGRNATRKEVFDYCMKRYGATMVHLRKLPSGKWECRHNGYH
jgi:hypothetical protein